ncbi:hypothetical protein KSS87_000506 [Heliosperma pusillum]|nr:hypothetical protein KSS87_000506 [Heliosperma pusillum]
MLRDSFPVQFLGFGSSCGTIRIKAGFLASNHPLEGSPIIMVLFFSKTVRISSLRGRYKLNPTQSSVLCPMSLWKSHFLLPSLLSGSLPVVFLGHLHQVHGIDIRQISLSFHCLSFSYIYSPFLK